MPAYLWFRSTVSNVIEALLFGAVLTIFVVYVFLNSWRSTLITALSLPTSVIAAFIAVWACGFTLNFMTLLGLSLAIGVLIDDAIVVRENIVRHMENGEDRMTAARNGTAEIGLAVAATTFSIVSVFLPVAFMGGGAGEWFRPFALTVAVSVLVSLYISFTLDPMLSAYWGDPVGYQHQPKKGLRLILSRFNDWFDHQANRYGNVIAWALHHRKWMTAIAFITFVGAIALQVTVGGSSFLPASDVGNIAVDIRTPSSSSLEYTKLKVEKAAEFARAIPETKATNSSVNPGGGRIYVDIGKSTERKRSAAEIAKELRESLTKLVGAEYVVLDDINNGVRKPVQILFSGPDARKLNAIAADFMEKLKKVPGAVDVGLSEQEPKDELKIELNRGLANAMGISVGDAAQTLRVAFAGVEVGDWVDPTGESRDVAVRLHPDDRPRFLHALEQVDAMPHRIDLDCRLARDGTPMEILHFRLESEGHGPALRIRGTAQDVSSARAAEAASAVAVAAPPAGWEYVVASDIADEISTRVAGYTATSYTSLDLTRKSWGRQPNEAFYYDGTSYENSEGLGVQLATLADDGKSMFQLAYREPAASAADASFPLTLVAAVRAYDGGGWMRGSKLLPRAVPAHVILSVADAQALGVGIGETVRISSATGALELRAQIDAGLSAGVVLLPLVSGVDLAGLLSGPQTRVALSKLG